MAVDSKSDPFSLSISGVSNLINSGINKVKGMGTTLDGEGVEGQKIDALEISMSEEELLSLARKWQQLYATYEDKIKLRQEANKTFYLGSQKLGSPAGIDDQAAITSNLIFEAMETFLPAALSKNPEPVVWSDNSPAGNEIADNVKTMLQYHADQLAIRSKLSMVTRKWALDFLGVIKFGWNNEIQDLKIEVRDAKNMLFDPEGYVDVYGDFTSWLGEKITVKAEKMIEMFPKKKDVIILMVDGKLGTECTYTEWWTNEYTFYTFKDVVLDKHKNPHFNYNQPGQEEEIAEDGTILQEGIEGIEGKNHFAYPIKPYIFLSVFNIQTQPHDITGLIEQNIPNQRLITRRTEQLDYNLSRANNSTVFSGENFNQQTAKQAATAWTKGHPILVPAGRPINEAVKDFPPPTVPDSFFTELQNNKDNLRSIFGVQGITAQQQDENQTARGMILNQQYDNSRIGGGIGDKLEMVARNIFNWLVQGYYVYYDEQHFASVVGQLKATEYIQLSAQNLTARLIVSVAPDSMKPHDEITEMNQAMTLMQGGLLDPQTFFQKINFPNPKETAGQYMLYKLNPMAYFILNFPEEAQAAGMMPQPQAPVAAGGAPGAPAPQGGGAQPMPPQPPGSTGGVPANSSISQVPLPK